MTAALKEVVSPFVSAARFWVMCEGWAAGLGFSKLAGFQSEVEAQEYSYNGRLGNVHTKQFGRPKPPSVTLERALDNTGFAQLFSWHQLARMNNPPENRDAGILTVEIGIAPVKPAEFVVFRISQFSGGAGLEE